MCLEKRCNVILHPHLISDLCSCILDVQIRAFFLENYGALTNSELADFGDFLADFEDLLADFGDSWRKEESMTTTSPKLWSNQSNQTIQIKALALVVILRCVSPM